MQLHDESVDTHTTRSQICTFTAIIRKLQGVYTAMKRRLQVVDVYKYTVTQSYMNEFLWNTTIVLFLQFVNHRWECIRKNFTLNNVCVCIHLVQ